MTNALQSHIMLYPDERVVSFLARCFPACASNNKRHSLDIGCGSGRHVKLMLDYGFQAWAIDYSPDSIRVVSSAFKSHPLMQDIVLGDFRQQSFPITFHAIVAWGVLFLAPPSEMVTNLQSMRLLLAPEGRLLVNFRTRENYFCGLGQEIEPGCFILDKRAGAYEGLCYTFTDLAEVKDIIARAGGFEIMNVEKTTFVKNDLSEVHSWLQVELKPTDL